MKSDQITTEEKGESKFEARTPRIRRLVNLGILGVLSILSTLGISYANELVHTSDIEKLRVDVGTLNAAVIVYRINGGDLKGLTDPEHVFLKLKSRLGNGSSTSNSPAIDPRVEIEYMLQPESDSDTPRAFWDAASQSFTIANAGEGGIKRFYFKDSKKRFEILEGFAE